METNPPISGKTRSKRKAQQLSLDNNETEDASIFDESRNAKERRITRGSDDGHHRGPEQPTAAGTTSDGAPMVFKPEYDLVIQRLRSLPDGTGMQLSTTELVKIMLLPPSERQAKATMFYGSRGRVLKRLEMLLSADPELPNNDRLSQEQIDRLVAIPSEDKSHELSPDMPTSANARSKMKSNDNTLTSRVSLANKTTDPATSTRRRSTRNNPTSGTTKGPPQDATMSNTPLVKSLPRTGKVNIAANKAQDTPTPAPTHSTTKKYSKRKNTRLITSSASTGKAAEAIAPTTSDVKMIKNKKSTPVSRKAASDNLAIQSISVMPTTSEKEYVTAEKSSQGPPAPFTSSTKILLPDKAAPHTALAPRKPVTEKSFAHSSALSSPGLHMVSNKAGKAVRQQSVDASESASTKNRASRESDFDIEDNFPDVTEYDADESSSDSSGETTTKSLRNTKFENLFSSALRKTENPKNAVSARTSNKDSKANNDTIPVNHSPQQSLAPTSSKITLRSGSKVDEIASTTSIKPVTSRVSTPTSMTSLKSSQIAKGDEVSFNIAAEPANSRSSAHSRIQSREPERPETSMVSTRTTLKRESSGNFTTGREPAQSLKASASTANSEEEGEPSSEATDTTFNRVPLNDAARPSSPAPVATSANQPPSPSVVELRNQGYFTACTALLDEKFPPVDSNLDPVYDHFYVDTRQTALFENANMVLVAQALKAAHAIGMGSSTPYDREQQRLVRTDDLLLADLRRFARGEEFSGVTGEGSNREFERNGVRFRVERIPEEN